jgi:hypothetical protein
VDPVDPSLSARAAARGGQIRPSVVDGRCPLVGAMWDGVRWRAWAA